MYVHNSENKPPPRKRRRDAPRVRQRAILESAARLICAKGYDGTSIQEIADACELTKAGLYHHFRSKEDLLAAITEYGMDLFEDEVLAQVSSIADPVERLKACMAKNIELVTRGSSHEVMVILHDHTSLHGAALTRINMRKKAYVRFLEDGFREAAKLGLVRPVDPTVAAFSFLGMVLWLYKWFRVDGRLTDQQVSDAMVDLLFGGLTKGDAS
jgi:AcrR family transcriptional regulator